MFIIAKVAWTKVKVHFLFWRCCNTLLKPVNGALKYSLQAPLFNSCIPLHSTCTQIIYQLIVFYGMHEKRTSALGKCIVVNYPGIRKRVNPEIPVYLPVSKHCIRR